MSKRNHQKCAGFTLTEIAIVLAIVGLIIGAIWAASKAVFDTNKATQAIGDITSIADNMRSTYMAVNGFSASGDQTVAMAVAGIFPADLLTGVPATPTKNAWTGAVKITLNPSGSNPRVFRISYLKTPADACFRIASQLANLGTADAPINLITNSGNTVAIPHTGNTVGLSTTTINTACALNTNSSNASTEFDFVK